MRNRILITVVCFAASLITGASDAKAKDDITSKSDSGMKVVTYNIRFASPNDGDDVWPNRRDFVGSFLQGSDVIGLQEVTAAQYDFLSEALTDFDSYGVGRDDGKRGGEHAPIFYRKSRFELVAKGTFWLSESPEAVGVKGWDAALPRTCTWVRLRQRDDGSEWYIANTHFDHRGANARAESGKLIASRVAALPKELPIIVMGDFNCLPDAKPYQALVGELHDARKSSRSEPTGPSSTWSGFHEIVPDRIIDHIFVRGVDVLGVAVHDPKTDKGRFASDHLPVQAIVRPAK